MRIATSEEIAAGKTTDVYFEQTVEVLSALDVRKTVTADVKATTLPDGASWAVAAGMRDALLLLDSRQVDVEAIEEGTIFGPGEPVSCSDCRVAGCRLCTTGFCADGVCTYRYQITNMGSALTLGTFCHENGHMLMGWPDLYDYGYDSTGAGVFCLMAYGGFALNPAWVSQSRQSKALGHSRCWSSPVSTCRQTRSRGARSWKSECQRISSVLRPRKACRERQAAAISVVASTTKTV